MEIQNLFTMKRFNTELQSEHLNNCGENHEPATWSVKRRSAPLSPLGLLLA